MVSKTTGEAAEPSDYSLLYLNLAMTRFTDVIRKAWDVVRSIFYESVLTT